MAAEIQVKLTTTADNVTVFKRALETIVRDHVEVGVPEEKAPRKAGSKISNAALAYIHNTGSPLRNIPARPFMEPGIHDAEDSITARMEAVAKAALKGDVQGVERGLNAVGLLVQNAIRRRINTGIPPPLKPGTLAARKRQNFEGEKPLIRTGQLRNSIVYVIKRITRRIK